MNPSLVRSGANLSIPTADIPQANDPARVLWLARFWAQAGTSRVWPAGFEDSRDRAYYRRALELLGVRFGARGEVTSDERLDPDPGTAQEAFARAMERSAVGSAWVCFQGVSNLHELDPSSAESFLEAHTELANATVKRRASTLRRWLLWCTAPAPASLEDALDAGLAGVETSSWSTSNFYALTEQLSRYFAVPRGGLVVTALQDPNCYGNRLSEATKSAPDALVLISNEPVRMEALERAYATRSLTRPCTLVLVRNQGQWDAVRVLSGDGRAVDAFPRGLPRSVSEPPAETQVDGESVAEVVELLTGISDQPDDALTDVVGEIPAELRHLVTIKSVGGGKKAHKQFEEALGNRPPVLILAADEAMKDDLRRAIEAQPTQKLGSQVLMALSNEGRFSVTRARPDEDEREATPAPSVVDVPAARRFDWKRASYEEWNERLIEYVFAGPGPAVVRIPATTWELCIAAGLESPSDKDIDAVMDAFTCVIRKAIHPGLSPDRFCEGPVPVPRGDVPHFFAVLWLTCLVCWGYPVGNEGNWNDRFNLVIGRSVWFHEVDNLWKLMASWCNSEPGYRALVLPPHVESRRIICRSYYLAFPHGNDRNYLSEVLADAGLQGRALPIPPTLRVLRTKASRFSKPFQEHIDEFTRFWKQGGRAEWSPFWRAVEQEARRPSHLVPTTVAQGTLFIRHEDDDLFHLYVAWPAVEPPAGADVESDGDLDDLDSSLLLIDTEPDPAPDWALKGGLLDPKSAAGLRQGVLLFESRSAWEYRLIEGADIAHATLAVVRDALVEAFMKTCAGREASGAIQGWTVLRDPNVAGRADLPSGLEDVDVLSVTAGRPQVRVVGVRAEGGFLWNKFSKPRIRAPGAVEVSVQCGSTSWTCSLRDDEWSLPQSAVFEEFPAAVDIVARWSDEEGDETTASTTFYSSALGVGYKPASGVSTTYWRESAAAPETVAGGAHLDSDLVTRSPNEVIDFLNLDGSSRFLGPGVGEMSTEPRPGFDWMVIGPWRQPERIIFVGDVDRPTPMNDGWCESATDRRHWRWPFTSKHEDRVFVASDSRFEPMSSYVEVQAEFRERARRIRGTGNGRPENVRCLPHEPTLDSVARVADRVDDNEIPDRLWDALDLVAALGLRRSGIVGRDFQSLALDLLCTDDFLSAMELRRSWEEAGVIDVLYRSVHASLLVVPRRPRFLLVKNGPMTVGILWGLVPRWLAVRVEAEAKAGGLTYQTIPRVFRYAPVLPVLQVASPEVLRTLSSRLGLADPVWLRWPRSGLPVSLSSADPLAVLREHPPDYPVSGAWTGTSLGFSAKAATPGSGPWVQRRQHPRRPAVHVVFEGGELRGWTYGREHALWAAGVLGARPFAVSDGRVESTGRAPAHLPLPIARICTLLGEQAPGPLFESGRVVGYRYPLGSRLLEKLRPLFPPHWL